MPAPAKRPLGYVPPLPNDGSKFQTPNTLRIDVHYANLLLVERWNWDRFNRLASFLQISHAELASAVTLPHRYLAQYERSNRIPNRDGNGRAVALILTLLESHVCGAWTNDVIANPFPSLNSDAQPPSS
jgi:hypothetical protein